MMKINEVEGSNRYCMDFYNILLALTTSTKVEVFFIARNNTVEVAKSKNLYPTLVCPQCAAF